MPKPKRAPEVDDTADLPPVDDTTPPPAAEVPLADQRDDVDLTIAPPAEVPLAEQGIDEQRAVLDANLVTTGGEVPLADQRDDTTGAAAGDPAGTTRMYHPDIADSMPAPDHLIAHYEARGWTTEAPVADDDTTTPNPEGDK